MKRYMSEEEFKQEMTAIQEKNEQKQKAMALKAEKYKYSFMGGIETNKLMAIYLFILLNTIIVFAMTAMWHFGDLSYLGVLISDIAAQVVIYAIYCVKAYHGKKQSEQMKLEKMKLGELLSDSGDENDEAVG